MIKTRAARKRCSMTEQQSPIIMEENNRGESEEDEVSSFSGLAARGGGGGGGSGAEEDSGDNNQGTTEEDPLAPRRIGQSKADDSSNNGSLQHNHDDGLMEEDDDNNDAAGDGDGTALDATDLISVKLEIDCDDEMNDDDAESKHSSTGSIPTNTPAQVKELRQEQLDSYLNLLERDQQQLNTLMVLKEREWDAILKLKKLKEIKIARLKRRREVEDFTSGGGGDRGPKKSKSRRSSTASLKALKNNNHASSTTENSSSGGKLGNKREVEARNNIRALEKEVNELANEVFITERHREERTLDFDGHSGLAEEGAFLASNALKSLVNKNNYRTTTTTPAGTSQSSSGAGKIIGEGRQGPKLDVSLLIADYRLNKVTQDYDTPCTQRRRLAPIPTLPPMNQSNGISFTNILSKMKTQYEKDRDLTTSPPSIMPVNNAQVIKTSKGNKGGATATACNSSSANKNSMMGTTLAKLLSTNNGNSVSRSLEESAMYNHKAASNNSAGSEKNLSLANLLASSKARDEPIKKKSVVVAAAAAAEEEEANVPVCQGCHSNKAQFVCAGCGNQWYCSRECQVAAWDEHAEVCSG